MDWRNGMVRMGGPLADSFALFFTCCLNWARSRAFPLVAVAHLHLISTTTIAARGTFFTQLEAHPRSAAPAVRMATSSEGLLDEASRPASARGEAFRRFLADPPWLTRVVFRRSGNHYTYGLEDDSGASIVHRHGGWVEYMGARQPGGFYLLHGSNSISYLKPDRFLKFSATGPTPGNEMVFGASESDWWQLASGHDMVQVASRKGLGQSARNGIEVIARYELEKLETLRFLGIPELADTGGAQWPDEARFVAESPHHGSIEGRILEWTGDFPGAVEYRVGVPSEPWIRVTYGYSPSVGLPPREIIRTAWQGSELLTLTTVIDV